LIALLPQVESYAWTHPVQEAAELLAATLRKMGDLNALALLPETLRLFRSIIDEADQDGSLRSAEGLNQAYLPILQALGCFSRQTTFDETDGRQSKKLHPVIHDHILALVQDLIDHLSRLPGPSNHSTPRLHRSIISRDILELLFKPRYLNPETMGFYMRYCTNNNIKRGSSIWWRCSLIALENGDNTMAKKFDIQATKAAKHEKKIRKGQEAEEFHVKGVVDGDEPIIARNEWMDGQGERIAGVMLTRHSTSFKDVVPTLEPRLHGQPEDTKNYAWAHLLNAARRDKSIETEMLRSLHNSIAESALSGHTLTAVMLGYMEKGKLKRAWQVWLDLVERQEAAPRGEEGRYVDLVALTTATYICHTLHGIDAAITLVDSWGRRAHSLSSPQSISNSVTLDTQVVNVLLHLCKIDKRASIAFRLFAASQPRWGVYTDAISLSLLLDTARHPSDRQDGDKPDLKSRLRQLAEQLRPRQINRRKHANDTYDAYDASGFSKGSVSVLLDQAGYTWVNENDEPPWLRAKAKFESILFTNWPWLPSIHSPLDYTHGPYAHKLRDFSSFFLTRQQSIEGGYRTPLRLPSNSSYAHLVPSAGTFHAYISMLGYYHLPEEISRTLAWMKALDIKPKKQTMITALMHIEAVEGPRRLFSDWDDGASRLLGDGDVLRRWLKTWLGRGVPTEEEVAVYVREYMRKHNRISA